MFNHILTSKWLQFFLLLGCLFLIIRGVSGPREDDVSKWNIIDKTLQRAVISLRNSAFDQFNRWDPREPTDDVIIVDIDENSLRDIGQWPWPRDVIAEMVLNLSNMGAKVIAFDMVFAEPDRMSPKRFAEGLVNKGLIDAETQAKLALLPDNDQVLSEAFRQAGNVVTGFTVARPEETRNYPVTAKNILVKRNDYIDFVKGLYSHTGLATNIDTIIPHIAGNGAFIAKPDHDGIIRKIDPIILFMPIDNDREFIYPSLALEALRVAHNRKDSIKIGQVKSETGNQIFDFFNAKKENNFIIRIGTSGIEIPIKSDGKVYLKFRHLDRKQDYVSAIDIIQNSEAVKEKIENKIILIGTSAEGLRDIRNTAIRPFVPGVEVHFNFIEQVLQKDFLFRDKDVSALLEFLIIFICGLFIILLSLYFGVTSLVTAIVIITSTIGFGCFYLYTHHNLLFDPVNASLSIFVIFVAATLLNYLRSEISKKEIRGAFGLYISPEFMEELTDNPDKLKLGGEMRDLTVMFTDIRNFTTVSESMTPEALINTMNDFLTPMSDVVMQTRGTIDKYMGDAMMAFWNAPLDDADHAKHAVDAALTMKVALEPVNEQLRIEAEEKGVEPLQLAAGIGINTGPCAVGNMGSKQRFAYSALGDAVNLASRLEGQTKSYGLDLLVGEETVNQIPDYAVMDIDLIQVKGKTKPVQIFTVMGNEDIADTDDYKNFIAIHNAFLKAYRDGDFEKSEQLLEDAQDHAIANNYNAYYAIMNARIKEYKKTPPQTWNGVFVATSK
jgi:adenylate cyclase